MNPNIVKCNVPLRTDSARPGRSVKTSSQPSCSSCMTHGAQSARLGSARISSDPSRATCRMASVETAAEHERILREIESTDTNCIGPTLR